MTAGSKLRRRLGWPLLALAVTLAAGTFGYVAIWNWSLADAFYMTATAVTAVGFGEVRPLTTGGQLFTVAVVAVGFGQIWYILSVLVGLAVDGELRGVWERRKMERRIEAASGHFLICGYGRVGRRIAEELMRDGHEVAAVDNDSAVLRAAADDGLLTFHGSATEDETLLRAGIERAGGLVAAVATDPDNVFVTLSAWALRSDLPIVAWANHDHAVPKLRRAGATQVVSPYAMAGRRMARLALRPATVDFVETLLWGAGAKLVMEDVRVANGSALDGLAIERARQRSGDGATLLAVLRDGETLAPPPPDLTLRAGDVIAAVGSADQLRALEQAGVGTGETGGNASGGPDRGVGG